MQVERGGSVLINNRASSSAVQRWKFELPTNAAWAIYLPSSVLVYCLPTDMYDKEERREPAAECDVGNYDRLIAAVLPRSSGVVSQCWSGRQWKRAYSIRNIELENIRYHLNFQKRGCSVDGLMISDFHLLLFSNLASWRSELRCTRALFDYKLEYTVTWICHCLEHTEKNLSSTYSR
jgi:hypothetical protein